jgi:hypothetical protein
MAALGHRTDEPQPLDRLGGAAFSYTYAKMSSPSRPASQALMTVVDVRALELAW